MDENKTIETFENARPTLLGLAYRILGSAAEAEDAVQDTYLKWCAADKAGIQTPRAWLTAVCTRRCIDMLRSARMARVAYVGTWLPEPVPTDTRAYAEEKVELASSLSTAFMLMLERLTPKERAAYLLYEIFDCSYREVAETLDIKEAACRKLVSRAKEHLGTNQRRHQPSAETQTALLSAFQHAIESGDMSRLGTLLRDDIELGADGGGKVLAVQRILAGKYRVLRFVERALSRSWQPLALVQVELNGRQALMVKAGSSIVATVSFEYDKDGAGQKIYIMRNPDKLKLLEQGGFVLH